MKRTIAIVAGGDTSEFYVSLRSAQGVYSFIDKEKYDLYIVEMEGLRWEVQLPDGLKTPVDRNDFSFMNGTEKVKFDFAYITIHGTPGEDGRLQGYLDMLRIPYSCCGVFAAALTFNKFVCNRFLSQLGFHVAKALRIGAGEEVTPQQVADAVGFPCFIKPNQGGSSFGTTKVKNLDKVLPAIAAARAEDDGEVLVESFLSGTEVSCGCYKTQSGMTALPVTEVISKNEFFDYEAKYTASRVEEITPARISDALTREIQELTARIYDSIGCKGIIRADYIIVDGTPYLLEVNTTPGMTVTSFIPQQVRAAGLDMKSVLTELIETELSHR